MCKFDRRSTSMYDLYDKTANFRKASVFLRDVHSSNWSAAFRLRGGRKRMNRRVHDRHRLVAVASCERANNRSYVPHGVHDEWLEKARLETEWQDAKLWIPPPTEFRLRGESVLFSSLSLSLSLSPPSLSMHVPLLPLGISTVWLPCSSSSTVFLHSSIAYCTTRFPPPPSFYSSLAIPPATNLHLVRLTSPETASAKLGFPLNPIVLLLRLVICPIPASSLSGFLYSTASSSPSRSAFRSSYSTHLHCVRRCSRINSSAELEDQAVSGCVFRAIDGINVILL